MDIAHAHHRGKAVVTFLASSFFLHVLWENLQAPLYGGYTSFVQHFWICFRAAWGDLLFMFIIYMVLAVVHRNPLWVAERMSYAHAATWLISVLIGTFLAASFELWAIIFAHRWQYTEAMPLVPVLQIGLTPILQMILIPLVVLSLTSRFSHPS